MKIFAKKADLQQYLYNTKQEDKVVGFVPTMGALHNGHLSLIKSAQQQCDVVVCSIFVNPTQFNDPKDLEIYPRPIANDIAKLEGIGCDILFSPEVDEMYAEDESWHLDLGEIENLLEGKFRPGHYQGVTQVVFKLFDIVRPDFAFFGQKDYQQFLVIQRMINLLDLPEKLVMCPIKRENDGLAMSSRNVHLSADERKHALILSKTLDQIKNHFDTTDLVRLKQIAEEKISAESNVALAYFEIADADTLLPATEKTEHIIALVAATVGKTRLIDNLILKT